MYTTYGFWTIENCVRMMNAPPGCNKTPVTMLRVVYNIMLIVGAYPAIIFTLGVIFFTCLIPYCFYDRLQKSRSARAEEENAKKLITQMFKVKYNEKVLTY